MSSNIIEGPNNNELIRKIKHYYKKSFKITEDFGGPSVYFHIECIKEQKNKFLSDRNIELIYATLSSWGLHRMGKTKTKMKDFDIFKKSIKDKEKELKKFLNYCISNLGISEYSEILKNLKSIYDYIKVSESDSTIVSHSKVLAHIFPNLIPPVDRQYTIRFFTQNINEFLSEDGKWRQINIPKDNNKQFKMFKDLVIQIKIIFDKCNKNIFNFNDSILNTSYPKIMDNLIMAFVKEQKNNLTKK